MYGSQRCMRSTKSNRESHGHWNIVAFCQTGKKLQAAYFVMERKAQCYKILVAEMNE